MRETVVQDRTVIVEASSPEDAEEQAILGEWSEDLGIFELDVRQSSVSDIREIDPLSELKKASSQKEEQP
jgi:hypothetical protein